MRRLARLWCRVRGHQTVVMSIGSPESGGGALTTCLRCGELLEQVEW